MSKNWQTNSASMCSISTAGRVCTSAARRLICSPTCAAGTQNLLRWRVGYDVRFAENGNARRGPCPLPRRGDTKVTERSSACDWGLCGKSQTENSIQSMPIGVHDARRLADLAGD
jgi:hypothetical protein